ncbi:MAG: hypothetical protein ACKV2T_43965 [Kofleriaceae bacterium]
MSRRVLLVWMACGCGRLGFDETAANVFEPDAASDGGVMEMSNCWAAWRTSSFSLAAPVMLDTLAVGNQRLSNPVLSATSLSLSYVSNTGLGDIMIAMRTAIDRPWMPTGPIAELETPDEEGRFATTPDELLGIYVRGTPLQLVETRRTTTGEAWGPPSPAPFVANTSVTNLYDPEITQDGLRLYYSNGTNLLVATRASRDDAFAAPQIVEVAATSPSDPVVSPDEQVMVFSSPGVTLRDLYIATRDHADGMFGPPMKLPGPLINTDMNDEGDADLSTDGCELVFSSNRNGRQIWSSRVMQ